MPYKHIATHLQKTELACRLHYHQLSFGTKRRKRTSSVSSMTSAGSTNSTYDPHYRFPVQARRSPPELTPSGSPETNSTTSTSVQTPAPVSILPKLKSRSKELLESSNSLQIVLRDPEYFDQSIESSDERARINRDRLARIYDAHRTHFWATIAQDYGENVTPSLLEDIWFKECATPTSAYPPTPPTRSPRSTQTTPLLASAFLDTRLGGSFSPINSFQNAVPTPRLPARASFAISTLLTEDKEVRNASS
jgi:hypothetical protein